jgi:hypothetical protein
MLGSESWIDDAVRLRLDVAKATYSEARNDIRNYEQRQTQAFNFALLVYGAELVFLGAVAKDLAEALTHQPNDPARLQFVLGVLAFFVQLVFPALIFPLAMVFIDVSIFNVVAHRKARQRFKQVVQCLDLVLNHQLCMAELEGSIDVLRAEFKLSLPRILIGRFFLFIYGPLGGLCPAVLFLLPSDNPFAPSASLLKAVIRFGFAFSLLLSYLTAAGIRQSQRIRCNLKPGHRVWHRIGRLFDPWSVG